MLDIIKEYEKLKHGLEEQYQNAELTDIIRKATVSFFLGKVVEIEIDRPVGSVHPKHEEVIYPINYGFIPNVLGGDGEELDVYLLGVSEKVSAYTCKVIAIIHRENDNEDKLVACPVGMKFTKQEIVQMTNFQEQFYIMKVEVLP